MKRFLQSLEVGEKGLVLLILALFAALMIHNSATGPDKPNKRLQTPTYTTPHQNYASDI